MEEGRFREDLYYRLNVLLLSAPPLRRRREDIPALAQHFLEKFATKNRKTVKGFSPGAMEARPHDWPGNVRVLENAVERGVILAVGEYLTERELPPASPPPSAVRPAHAGPPVSGALPDLAGQPLEDIEQRAILATLRRPGEQERGRQAFGHHQGHPAQETQEIREE